MHAAALVYVHVIVARLHGLGLGRQVVDGADPAAAEPLPGIVRSPPVQALIHVAWTDAASMVTATTMEETRILV